MSLHPRAGQPATPQDLIHVAQLLAAYTDLQPDPANPLQRVAFGTSGHRGSAFKGTFNEAHILAISQAVAEYRACQGISGPLYLGHDTHALSAPARDTALSVLAANGVVVLVQQGDLPVATPVVSRAIVAYNRGRKERLADGVLITPSHNPPEDGGFKYNPPHGGPADTAATGWIQTRANELLASGNRSVRRVGLEQARAAGSLRDVDMIGLYVAGLAEAVDMERIAQARLRLGVDPLGGASLPIWDAVAERYGLDLTVVDRTLDPTFGFMRLDKDGRIRMDCSSPYAMAGLIGLREDFDLAFACDPDADRHGIVAPSVGLMNPNHYLAVAIDYLFRRRPDWSPRMAVGKTLVSSSLIDRVAAALQREVYEVPVGFKWFVEPLLSGHCAFGGEESAGASFLEKGGRAWTTDKDGPLLCLLAAEMTAVSGKDPGRRYAELAERLGAPVYERRDAPCSPAQKKALGSLSPAAVTSTELAGEPLTAVLTTAPGNGAAIGGLKVTTANGWFAARPSGTEDVYKIYAESFLGQPHLQRLFDEAQAMVDAALAQAHVQPPDAV